MYQDEQTQAIQQSAMQTFHTVSSLSMLMDRLERHKKPNPFNPNQPFTFSGQYTDLCYFIKNPHMAISEINDIDNPDLREAVRDNFSRAEKEGLIRIDREKGIISVTDKGEKYINRTDFGRAARDDQSRAFALMREKMANERGAETSVVSQPEFPQLETREFFVELNGTDNDLAYFLHTDTLDASAVLNSPDNEAAKKVMEKLAEFENLGVVRHSGDVFSLTEKGELLLSQDSFKRNFKVEEKSLEALLPKEEVITFEFTGGASDLEYFNRADSLNLFNLRSKAAVSDLESVIEPAPPPLTEFDAPPLPEPPPFFYEPEPLFPEPMRSFEEPIFPEATPFEPQPQPPQFQNAPAPEITKPQITEKVVDNFYKMQEAGLVEIDKNMTATLTVKGRVALDNGVIGGAEIKGAVKLPVDIVKPLSPEAAKAMIAEKGAAVLGAPGVVVIAVKKAANVAVKSVVNSAGATLKR